ncbi:glycerate kinase family protein [Lactococcus termiticola]|uniref:Glycerate kinase n=1 Tax=Lactococcus termiticola TaxID=2169526 RepID=A0A2R5HI27_9LACT|nr:glycerate kinase [Lactococcus termiticola]GBG97125.1 glycerate kinase [Lactococcus termiticola]
MKILVAVDSFKGSASSHELNQAVKKGVLSLFSDAEVLTFDVADGGEGSLEAIRQEVTGEMIPVETLDLLGRSVQASYLLAGQQAFIEGATVLGIDKIRPSSETVAAASSRGLAKLVLDAKKRGATEILLALGGTGSSDGGLGFYEALEKENLSGLRLIGLTDVDNVYAGPEGYARTFARQKGASPEQIEAMDQQALQFAKMMKQEKGIDLQAIAGTGAAGGLGGAIALLDGELKSGFQTIASIIGLDQAIPKVDLVVTGEGRLDAQSQKGKVPYGIARLAERASVPVIALAGTVEADLGQLDELLLASFSIQSRPLPLDEAMKKEGTLANVERTAREVSKAFFRTIKR